MECPKELVDYVEGATLCALTGFTGNESSELVEELKTLINEKDFVAQIEMVNLEVKGKTR